MKRLLFMIGVAFVLAAPSSASNSLAFSTALGANYAWSLQKTGGNWTLSFPDRTTVVDTSIPLDPILIGDFVQLPRMTLTDITDGGTFLIATLTPQEPLIIRANPAQATELIALMKPGSVLITGTTFAAYSQPRDDLDVTNFDGGYSVVIPGLGAQENAGLPLDISFTGDRKGDSDLRTFILSGTGSAQGTLSGQIVVIPLPGALLLASLGLGLILVGRSRAARRPVRI
jgi:hypothetical protein